MYSISLSKERHKFSSAHFTMFPDGSVERLHGHNYYVEVGFVAGKSALNEERAGSKRRKQQEGVGKNNEKDLEEIHHHHHHHHEKEGDRGREAEERGREKEEEGEELEDEERRSGGRGDGEGILDRGILFPFDQAKKMIYQQAMLWDEMVILPTCSDWLDIKEVDQQIEARLHTPTVTKFYSFPKEDVLLLPCNNTSSENLAAMFLGGLLQKMREDGKFLAVEQLDVTIIESAGQKVTVSKRVQRVGGHR